MRSPLERLGAGEILCGDGAWGTQLMARGLAPGDCPESMNLARPEVLADVAGLYLDAGADLVTTNTFGGSPLNLSSHGLDDRTEEINRAAVEVLGPVTEGRAYISASVGPTGKILEPYGVTAEEVVAEAFSRQIGALIDAGADLICIETMIDLREAELAVRAARSLSADVPLIATMTFDATPNGFFTTMGNTVEQACTTLIEAGADIVGSNCGNGIETMIEIARKFSNHASVPVIIQSNAGLPENRDGQLVYPESPEFMAERVGRLMDLGVGIIGGCCGTTPDHIRAIRTAIDANYRTN
ncbi:MAG: homocysteine S-methyltransferase family protein [Thermoanaerobaculales bacterium]|nr:homocysteine S-methyltransferase family protein [Thermoanaerobaculales bacterium]